jgi:hypothetical protein
LNFKGTPSKEEQKTIFSGCKMALSNQIDFPEIFRLRKMTYRNLINTGIDNLLSPLPRKMASAAMF